MLMRQLNLHSREATTLFFNYKEQLGDCCIGPAGFSVLIISPFCKQGMVCICVFPCSFIFSSLSVSLPVSLVGSWIVIRGSHTENLQLAEMLRKVQLVSYCWDEESRTLYRVYSIVTQVGYKPISGGSHSFQCAFYLQCTVLDLMQPWYMTTFWEMLQSFTFNNYMIWTIIINGLLDKCG